MVTLFIREGIKRVEFYTRLKAVGFIEQYPQCTPNQLSQRMTADMLKAYGKEHNIDIDVIPQPGTRVDLPIGYDEEETE